MARTGRPKKLSQEHIPKLKAFMRMKPTLKDTAAWFEVSEDTIERFIKKNFKLTYAEFRDQNMVVTRFNLIRTAITKAENGDNTMLIFCLKNLCGWKDKHEISTDDERGFTLNYSLDKK